MRFCSRRRRPAAVFLKEHTSNTRTDSTTIWIASMEAGNYTMQVWYTRVGSTLYLEVLIIHWEMRKSEERRRKKHDSHRPVRRLFFASPLLYIRNTLVVELRRPAQRLSPGYPRLQRGSQCHDDKSGQGFIGDSAVTPRTSCASTRPPGRARERCVVVVFCFYSIHLRSCRWA